MEESTLSQDELPTTTIALEDVRSNVFDITDCEGKLYDFVKPWHVSLEHEGEFKRTFGRMRPHDIYLKENYYVSSPKEVQRHEAKVKKHEERRVNLLNQDKTNKDNYYKWVAYNQRVNFQNTRAVNARKTPPLPRSKALPFFNMIEYNKLRDESVTGKQAAGASAAYPTLARSAPHSSSHSTLPSDQHKRAAVSALTPPAAHPRGGAGHDAMSSRPGTRGSAATRESFGPRPARDAESSRPSTRGTLTSLCRDAFAPASHTATYTFQASQQLSPKAKHSLRTEVKDLELFETRLQIINSAPLEDRLRRQLDSMRVKQARPKSVPLKGRLEEAKVINNPRPATSAMFGRPASSHQTFRGLQAPNSRVPTPMTGIRIAPYSTERNRLAWQ